MYVAAVRRHQTLGQGAVERAVEEVIQRDMLGMRRLANRAFSQVTMRNHQIDITRQGVDGGVGYRHIAQTGVLHFLAQHACTHGAGTHTGVTGHDDFTHVMQLDAHGIAGDGAACCALAFRLRFHLMHALGRGFNIVIFFDFAGFQQDRGDHEGDRKGRDNRRDIGEVGAFRRHRQHRQDRAWRGRRNQTAIEHASE